MKITVHVKPRANKEKVEKIDEVSYVVSVREPPVEGKANRAVIAALAVHFHTPPSSITILRGHNAKIKLIETPTPAVVGAPTETSEL